MPESIWMDAVVKLPVPPPTTPEFWLPDLEVSLRFRRMHWPQGSEGKYLHWDQLIHFPAPEGFTHEEWWRWMKHDRRLTYQMVPLRDHRRHDLSEALETRKWAANFMYNQVNPIPRMLHEITLQAAGVVQAPDSILNAETRDRYLVSSLMEEAIASSQLEGAATTRKVAKEMIRSGRVPRDRSERMILNNYLTMQRIRELRDEPLSRDLVFEIHGMITEDTLHDARGAGRFRRPDEPIHVVDYRGADEIELHMPPPAEELEGRMEAMCGFANEKISSTDPVRASRQFVHPVIRSIILHFWLAYDHPFVDGNGRTARALFYWSMLRHGFWLFEFISITRILLKAKSKYTRAFLYTETDENDLTYFILHQLEVIDRAIKELHAYLDRKKKEMEAIERELRHAGLLNERQRALLTRALKEPATRFTFRSHQVSHNVVYQTARNDLLGLKKHGLLEKCKIGRTWYFTPVEDLPEKLSAL